MWGFLVLPIILSGCGGTGFLTGDTQPDAWAKIYCFDGQGAVRAGGNPWAAGETMGEMKSRGLVVSGAIDPEVLKTLIDAGCTVDTEVEPQ